MRILIIQTAFIGDVVLTTPLIAAAQKRWPGAEVHFVSTPAGCEVLAGLSNVVCHCLDKKHVGFVAGLNSMRAALKGFEPFDYIFCVHRSVRSLLFGVNTKASKKIAFRSMWARLLGYETVAYPPYDREVHYADKPLALLAPLLSPGEALLWRSPRPKLAVVTADDVSVRGKIPFFADGFFVLSPFSVWGTKTWFADRFSRLGAELCSRLQLSAVILGAGGAFEAVTAKTIEEKISQAGGQALSLVGKTTLGELKAIIRQAKILVANDSAPVHIASAFDVPTVAIFGPTARKWGFFPLSTRSTIIARDDLSCRPCHLHGPQKCPKGHFRCMSEIQVEDVLKGVEDIL